MSILQTPKAACSRTAQSGHVSNWKSPSVTGITEPAGLSILLTRSIGGCDLVTHLTSRSTAMHASEVSVSESYLYQYLVQTNKMSLPCTARVQGPGVQLSRHDGRAVRGLRGCSTRTTGLGLTISVRHNLAGRHLPRVGPSEAR